MFVYAMGPIENWEGWRPAEGASTFGEASIAERAEFREFFSRAREIARELGWEGDISEGPFVSALPDPAQHGSAIMVAWRQSKNGTTFVASPFRIPYLENESWKWGEG
jgi:hypothetical protein